MSADQVDALVIFGATGDLAKLETFPALVGLVERGVLDVPVLGVAKSGWGVEQFRNYAASSLMLNKMDPTAPAAVKMLNQLKYVDGDLDDPQTYEWMKNELGDAKKILFYLEVPPSLFGRIAEGISGVGLAAASRVMVEKPFGYDLESALELNDTMHKYFPEESVYRVDHWLGLDPVESLMFARFANSIIEPLLNRNYVRSIQITMAEAFDVADRGSFYDKTGAIKDVIQNHMLQVLATVLADPPDGSGIDSWISSKARLIGALRPLTAADVVKGQYDGYLSVDGVPPGSKTETFAGVRLAADTWRWDGVPIAIRAGKCMAVTADRRVHRLQAAAAGRVRAGPRAHLQRAPVPRVAGEPGGADAGRQEAGRQLGARGPGPHVQPAPRGRHAPVRPADRRGSERRALAVRPAGHGRRRLAGGRPDPR